MKKKYIYLILFYVLPLIGTAQIINDDFESYPLGDMGCQNPTVWNTWSGVCDDGSNLIIEDNIVFAGEKSGYVGEGSVQDVVLLLGNQTEGDYTLSFNMYITGGSTGYFNIQGHIVLPCNPNCTFNSSNIYFNNGAAAPGVVEDQTLGETGLYPEDTWFPVSIYFDVDNSTYLLTVDGIDINASPVPFQGDSTLGGIDFFSIDSDNNYWLDDVLFTEGLPLSTDHFAANKFSVYPNPVTDVLNIRSSTSVDAVQVFDVLGKLVISTTPDAISPTVDMSSLNSGPYFVKVTIDDASKTVKIVK